MIQAQKNSIAALAYLDEAQVEICGVLDEKPQDQVSLVVSGVEVYLPLEDLVDKVAERERLEKRTR